MAKNNEQRPATSSGKVIKEGGYQPTTPAPAVPTSMIRPATSTPQPSAPKPKK